MTRSLVMLGLVLAICFLVTFFPPVSVASDQDNQRAVMLSAFRAMGNLAAAERTYYSMHNQYGTFEEVKKMVGSDTRIYSVFAGTLGTIIEGYTVQWLLNEDKSYWIAVALPNNPDRLGFMTDATNYDRALALAPANPNQTYPHPWPGFKVVEGEKATFNQAKTYGWIYTAELNNPQIPLYLLLDDQQQAYAILQGEELIFLSSNSTLYMVVPWQMDFGYTVNDLLDRVRLEALQSRANGAMRSLGSCELAYQSIQSGKRFGTFAELQQDQDVAMGYTLDNIIEGFCLILMKRDGSNMFNNAFIAIAFPNAQTGLSSESVYGRPLAYPVMVDETQVLHRLILAGNEFPAGWKEIIDAEATARTSDGHYQEVTTPEGFTLFLSPNADSFILRFSQTQPPTYIYPVVPARMVYVQAAGKAKLYYCQPVL